MFEKPIEWAAWNRKQAVKEAVSQIRQENFQNHQNGVERNFAAASQGERSFEFGPAYQTLLSLDKNVPANRRLLQSIYYAPNRSAALFEWWDATVGPHFRAAAAHSAMSRLPEELRSQVLTALNPQQHQQQQDQGGGRQNGQRQSSSQSQQGQPRHEFRPAQTLPSLNSATGSNVHRTTDPDLYDNLEGSVFAFATR